MSPQSPGSSLSYQGLSIQLDAWLFSFSCPDARPLSVFPPRLWDQSAKLRRHPEVAACRLASGGRHNAQTTEGPYSRQAVPRHPSPCCRRVPRPGRYSRREAALRVRRAERAPGLGGGARRSAQLCSLRPASGPQSRRGAEGAERPALSQAPAGGAPGHSARSSGRPLLEPPRDHPRGESLDAQVTSKFPLRLSRPVSHMLCLLERINLNKLMIDALHSPAQLPQKTLFLCPLSPRTHTPGPTTPTPGSLTAQIL